MIHVIGSSGLGDAILSLQASFYINEPYKNHICARDEVFYPLKHLFRNYFILNQWPEDYVANYRILHDKNIQDKICGSETDERYFVLPDLLFRGPLSFDYKKFNTNPQLIRSTRLLTNRYKPESNKIIYIALSSSTPNYSYNNIGCLLRLISGKLPEYTIFFPKLDNWAGYNLDYGDLSNMPQNVIIRENPDFIECIDVMKKSEFGICTDNGPSHIFYQLGCPRLILDPQWNNLPWIARWREDYNESIPINLPANIIANLIEILIKESATQLIPRVKVLEKVVSNDYNWKDNLLIKF